MKSFRKVLLIITVIALLCVLVACGENAGTGPTPGQGEQGSQGGEQGGGQGGQEQGGSNVKPLDTPYLVLDGEVAYWKPIENADGYEIELNGEGCGIFSETSYKLQAGDSLRVRAISGNPDKYEDSAFSNTVKYNEAAKEKLDTPMIKIDYTDGRQVFWESVDNATSYVCEIDGGESVIGGRRIGPYNFGTVVRVKARDNNGEYADSDYSESVTIGAMSDCTQVTDLSEYVGTYMTYEADQYVVVGEDNKVTICYSPNTDIGYTEEVEIFVKQEDEDTTILAKGDDYIEKVVRVSDEEAAFSFMNDTYYKLVAGNNFGDSEDVYGIYCNYENQDDYRFAELTQTTVIADGVSYNLYKFVDTFEDFGESFYEDFNGTFYYDNGKYIYLNFVEGLGGNDPDRFRFNERAYNIIKQATEIPNEKYVQSKDDYRLLLGDGDIIFLTYVKEDGKVYFNFDLGTGKPVRKSLWVMGKDYCYFSPTDENDFTTLKRVYVGEEQVSFGDSLYFNEIYESKLYNYFHTPSNNFVSADFVSTKLTSMITVDRYGQFLTKFGSNPTKTDFKVFDGRNGYTLLQINGKYYRFSFEHNEENNYRTEGIRITVNSSSGDSVERYCLMEDVSFDFNGTYRNNVDSIVLNKDGKLKYDNVEYQVVTIDGKKYARNDSTFKLIAKVDENYFQFVSEAQYSTSDLIEATIDEVLGDLDLSCAYGRVIWTDRAIYQGIFVSDNKVYYHYINASYEATLYKDASGKLTAIGTYFATYPASIVTNEDGEATIAIDGYECYKPKTVTIPDEYIGKRYYTFKDQDSNFLAQDTLYFAEVYDGSQDVKGLFVLNANDNNIVHTRRTYNYRILEDFDFLQETRFTKESEMSLVGNVYCDSDALNCAFEFRDDGSIMYNGNVYYEVKQATSVPSEYRGLYYDKYRRVIESIERDAVRTETSRVEILTYPETLSYVYFIENERGGRLYLKEFYQNTKYSQGGRNELDHPLRQLIGYDLVKLQETPDWLGNAFIKQGSYYTRFYNDLYDGFDSQWYDGHPHIDYFGFTFRAYNDVTYVRNVGGYSQSDSIINGNIDSRYISFSINNASALISQKNVKNRCYYYETDTKYCFVYQFPTEAIQICFEKTQLGPNVEKTAEFYILERTDIGNTEAPNNEYSLVLNHNDESTLKYVSIVNPTSLPDGMLGNYLLTRSRLSNVNGVYNTDLSKYHRVFKTSDGKFKFQELHMCNNSNLLGRWTYFDYDIKYDEATGRYLYGHYRTWTDNASMKIDAATDFEPVGELIYDNGTLTVKSFNARQSIMDGDSYVLVQNDSEYSKLVAADVNFASLGMVGKTYFGMDYNGGSLHTIVNVTSADTVNMYLNIGLLDFFDAKLILTSTVENAADNSVKYVGYLVSVDDETSVYIPIAITKYESGEIEFNFNYFENGIYSYDDFVITEVHESSVLKGVEGVVEFKSRAPQEGKELTETAIFDSENNTITFTIGDNYEGDNLQTHTVTTFYYNADDTMMYCIAGGRVFFFTFVNGKIETTWQVQFVERKLRGNGVAWFEFYVPEETEGGETSGEQTGEGVTSGETNA